MAGSSREGNPYVGPRPFETGEHLFGREREIAELYYLLSAERIVLLHSPSGAGKSSLIQAGLLPRLRERFDVWRPTRVNLPLPAAISEEVNRYVLSAALGFEQGIPEELRRAPDEIGGMTLSEYARTRARRPSAPESVLLIFDQFEEILTIDPLAVEAKRKFFDQLGDLLHDPTYWALLAMREDYLAPLDPYSDQVPTHLKNRFRIDLLGLDEAREAVAMPSVEGGREFERLAVEKLVRDLATMKVQQPDGSFVEQTGLHVEPLQLQVVCRGLWDRLLPDRFRIGLDDVERFGNVTEALAEYYSVEVGKIGRGNLGVERALREWIGDQLITPDGIRGQVLRGAGKSEGLANSLVAELVNTHLVRAEQRAGAVWYELAHDRLIEPSRTNNAAWREAHLHPVQKLASLWETLGRPVGPLLLGNELVEAKQWAEKQIGLTEVEIQFLLASGEAQEDAEKERRQLLRIRWLAAISTVLCIVAGVALKFAWNESQESARNLATAKMNASQATASAKQAYLSQAQALASANQANISSVFANSQRVLAEKSAEEAKSERVVAEMQTTLAKEQGTIASAGRLIAQASQLSLEQPNHLSFATLLALESFRKRSSVDADEFLRDSRSLLRQEAGERIEHTSEIRSVAFSRDGRLLATASADNTARVSDAITGRKIFVVHHADRVDRAIFSPDGKYLATTSLDKTARLWDAHTGAAIGQPFRLKTVHGLIGAAFSVDGRYLATSSGETISIWDVRGFGSPVFEVTAEESPALASIPIFTPDGKYVVTSVRGKGRVWQIDGWKEVATLEPESGLSAGIRRLMALSPDGRYLATTRSLFEMPSGKLLLTISLDGGGVEPAFSSDGRSFATSEGDAVNVWATPLGTRSAALRRLGELKNGGPVTALAFSPKTGYIASSSRDGTARIWQFPPGRGGGAAREVGRIGTENPMLSVAFNPNGSLLATVFRGKVFASSVESSNLQLWKTDAKTEEVLHYGIPRASILPSGSPVTFTSKLVAAGDRQGVHVIEADSGREVALIPATDDKQDKAVGSIALSPDSLYLATAAVSDADTDRIWNLQTRREVAHFASLDKLRSFLFSPDGNYLATAYEEGIVEIHRVLDGQRVGLPSIAIHNPEMAGRLPVRRTISKVAFSSTRKFLAVAGIDSKVHVLETGSWIERYIFPVAADIREIVFSGNGEYLAAATYAPQGIDLYVWRLADGKMVAGLSHTAANNNTAVALSPDGGYIAVANWSAETFSRESNLQIWQVAQSRLVTTLPLKEEVWGLAFSSDGRYLAISSKKGMRVWDQRLSTEVAGVDNILGNDEFYEGNNDVIFSPDGNSLLVKSAISLNVWHWSTDRVVGQLCDVLTSNLSVDDWKQYLPGEPYRRTCPNLPAGGEGTINHALQGKTSHGGGANP